MTNKYNHQTDNYELTAFMLQTAHTINTRPDVMEFMKEVINHKLSPIQIKALTQYLSCCQALDQALEIQKNVDKELSEDDISNENPVWVAAQKNVSLAVKQREVAAILLNTLLNKKGEII